MGSPIFIYSIKLLAGMYPLFFHRVLPMDLQEDIPQNHLQKYQHHQEILS